MLQNASTTSLDDLFAAAAEIAGLVSRDASRGGLVSLELQAANDKLNRVLATAISKEKLRRINEALEDDL